MWVLLSQIGAQLVYPLSLMFIFTIIGLIYKLFRRHKSGNFLIIAGVLILYMGACPTLAYRFLADLEQTHLPTEIEKIAPADAILMLGGAIGLPLAPRLESDLSGGADRVRYAAQLYRAGRAPMIVVSGGNVFTQDAQPESTYIVKLLQEWGVNPRAILAEGRSRNTYENALYSKELLQEYNIDNVLLVTSAFHMPRALATFQSAGINARAAPTDYHVIDANYPSILNWIPTTDALQATNTVIHEYLGMLVYRLRGWIKQ